MTNSNKHMVAAVREAFKAEELNEASKAHGVLGLQPVLASPSLLSARVGKDEKPYLFKLEEAAFPRRKPDGSIDGKLRTAVTNEILERVYLIPKADLPFAAPAKRLFNATFGAALWLRKHPEVTLGVNGAGQLTNVPFELAFDFVDGKGQPTDAFRRVAAFVEANASLKGRKAPEGAKLEGEVRKMRFVATGRNHPAFGNLRIPSSSQVVARMKAKAVEEGLIPAPEGRDRDSNHTDDGETLMASLRFVGKTVAAWNNPDDDGKATAATSPDLEAEIRRLVPVLTHWVANNPKA